MRREYDNYLEGEQREMVELFEKKGVRHEDAELVRTSLLRVQVESASST